MKKLILFFLIPILFLSNVHSYELETECYVTQEHFTYSISCNSITKICNFDEYSFKHNDSRLVFTNQHKDSFTSFVSNSIKLPRFPQEIFDHFVNLVHVHIEYGDFRTIYDYSFTKAYKLMELELTRNKIREITLKTFTGAGKVVKLDLSMNEIKELTSNVFEHMHNLEYLNLAYNQIEWIHVETFGHLKNLRTLKMSYNELQKMDPKTFVQNHRLLFMDLGGNPMHELELELDNVHLHKFEVKGVLRKLIIRKPYYTKHNVYIDKVFAGFSEIRRLSDVQIHDSIIVDEVNLRHGAIAAIDNSPEFLRHVRVLNLEGNDIREIPHYVFSNLINLKDLELSGNKNLRMEPMMFSRLKYLKTLTLKSMKWEHLDPEWFTGLESLENLNLMMNHLSSFDYERLINKIPTLKMLNVDSNEFTCDYLRDMMSYLRSFTQARVRTVGDEPFERGRYYNRVYGVACDVQSTASWILFLIIGVVVFVLVALVTIVLLCNRKKLCGKKEESYTDVATAETPKNTTEDTKET